ncbi:MAG: acetyltransferase [bacterium]
MAWFESMMDPLHPPTLLFDVFNGDADGICALHQLRLKDPARSTLITGVKRHTRLLEALDPPSGAQLTVLDVAMKENGEHLRRLLQAGCRIRYFDHHFPGEIPEHPRLEAHIDTSPDVCTSLLVDRALDGAFRAWAVTAAFGDNLHDVAREAAAHLGLEPERLEALRELGELLNYNAYGDTLADLHFHPADLYRALSPYADPLDFFHSAPETATLREGYRADMAMAAECKPLLDDGSGRVLLLPGAAWARRVQGIFANRMANERPDQAHVLGVENPDGTLRLSIRAPMERPRGADALARSFPNGGGRAGAAGINSLPPDTLTGFIDRFRQAFSKS